MSMEKEKELRPEEGLAVVLAVLRESGSQAASSRTTTSIP